MGGELEQLHGLCLLAGWLGHFYSLWAVRSGLLVLG